MKYLLDTDVVISYLKGIKGVVTILQEHERELGISVITLGELLEGIYTQPKEKERLEGLKKFLSDINLLEVDENIVEKFAKIRSNLRERGQLIDNFDILIAATALTNNLILITANKKDFERIEDLKIL